MRMLQSEFSEQKRSDVFNAYNMAIGSLGEAAKYVSKASLVDRAMKYTAPRFYVTYERAARVISSIRKGRIPKMRNRLKFEMYRDIYHILVTKTDGSMKALREVLDGEAPSFYIDRPHFERLIRQSLRGGRS